MICIGKTKCTSEKGLLTELLAQRKKCYHVSNRVCSQTPFAMPFHVSSLTNVIEIISKQGFFLKKIGPSDILSYPSDKPEKKQY